MTNVYKIDHLNELLTCPICLERFQNPKVLPCQHTFCCDCLRKIFDNRQKQLPCPTCRKTIHLKRGPDELPISVTIVSLMDIQPMEAKCPSCDQMGKLTICEHCQTTKCSNCNEKHVEEIRKQTKNALEKLQSTDENHFKISIQEEFRQIQKKISKQFQEIRQQHDAIFLAKQMEILQQLKRHEENLVSRIDADLQSFDDEKGKILKKNQNFETKNETELIDLLSKTSDLQTQIEKKIFENEKLLNSIEISLQYDPNQIEQINQMCNSIQLSLIHTSEDKSNQQAQFTNLSEPVKIVLRTSLNREYQCRIRLDQTIRELKEIFARQENLQIDRITLTKAGSFFDQLDDNRTLQSYDCHSSTVLMVSIRR